MAKKILIAFLTLNIIAAILYFATTWNQRDGQQEVYAHVAANVESAGAMKASSFLRLAAIDNTVIAKGMITDSDLDEVISIMDHPLNNTDSAKSISQQEGLPVLHDVPHYTPAQSARVYRYVKPLLKSPSFGVRANAAEVFGRLGDKRIVPELIPLLHDAHAPVVKWARASLDELGYHAE